MDREEPRAMLSLPRPERYAIDWDEPSWDQKRALPINREELPRDWAQPPHINRE